MEDNMSENFEDLGELGDRIKKIIDTAVATKDYRQMTEDIKQTVGQTVNSAVNSAVDSGSEAIKNGLNSMFGSGNGQSSNYEYHNKTKEFEERRRREREQEQERKKLEKQKAKERMLTLYDKNTGGRMKGMMLAISGGLLASGMGLGTLVLSVFGAMGHMNSLVLGGTCLLAAGALTGVGLLAGGIKKLGRLERFQKYIDTLGTHTYCNFEQLSAAVNKPVKFVKKDIKKMIDNEWFRQGHIDEQETCLITSNETYQQYTQTIKALEDKKQEEERIQAEQKKNRESISPEVQEVLDKGNEFLDKIHKSNDAIPGVEISAKISRMELIVEKIFERAEKHPEIIPDLKKMMNYYLPMTVKLLDAYEEMDEMPVQGENIQSSKKEIEDTLDTLNQAFEKLLDSVFQETAWDVSSDISVLHTLLAQEGLTDEDFAKMKNN
jgi:5-bromo-4-chloroindolyl phosphate hydrolysis protein